jgi:hypothetical protein
MVKGSKILFIIEECISYMIRATESVLKDDTDFLGDGGKTGLEVLSEVVAFQRWLYRRIRLLWVPNLVRKNERIWMRTC